MAQTTPAGNVHPIRRSVHRWVSETTAALTSVFFPADCRLCGTLLLHAQRAPVCQHCFDSFAAPPYRKCEVCGQPLPLLTAPQAEELRICPACQQKTYAFQRARSFGIYEGALARAVILLKFEELEPLARWFAHRLAEMVWAEGDTLAADVVVPVPLHRTRQKERGYNQAALVSKALARKLDLPHKAVLLLRTRPRPDKQVLSLAERWTSVRGAFATRPGSQVDNLRVLLVDDVLTTGATLDACSRALLDSGAKSVVGLTIARAASKLVVVPANVKRS